MKWQRRKLQFETMARSKSREILRLWIRKGAPLALADAPKWRYAVAGNPRISRFATAATSSARLRALSSQENCPREIRLLRPQKCEGDLGSHSGTHDSVGNILPPRNLSPPQTKQYRKRTSPVS